jgi:hypothetical protein
MPFLIIVTRSEAREYTNGQTYMDPQEPEVIVRETITDLMEGIARYRYDGMTQALERDQGRPKKPYGAALDEYSYSFIYEVASMRQFDEAELHATAAKGRWEAAKQALEERRRLVRAAEAEKAAKTEQERELAMLHHLMSKYPDAKLPA